MTYNIDLEASRKEIDHIDQELKQLFLHRMQIVAEVANYKAAENLPICHPDREAEVLSMVFEGVENELRPYISCFFKHLLYLSKERQKEILGKLNT